MVDLTLIYKTAPQLSISMTIFPMRGREAGQHAKAMDCLCIWLIRLLLSEKLHTILTLSGTFLPFSSARLLEQLLMRAGEHRPTRYHPAAIGMMISELLIDCYWFLWVGNGKIGAPLHCGCTVPTPRFSCGRED